MFVFSSENPALLVQLLFAGVPTRHMSEPLRVPVFIYPINFFYFLIYIIYKYILYIIQYNIYKYIIYVVSKITYISKISINFSKHLFKFHYLLYFFLGAVPSFIFLAILIRFKVFALHCMTLISFGMSLIN